MPDPENLRLLTTADGESVVVAGKWVLHRFATEDAGMRKLAMVSLTQARYPVKTVAAIFGVHPNYLSMLRTTARRDGSAGLVKTRGRPAKLSPTQVTTARQWAQQGLPGQEIARRLGVSDTTISRLTGTTRRTREPVQDELSYPEPEPEHGPAPEPEHGSAVEPASAPEPEPAPEQAPEPVSGSVPELESGSAVEVGDAEAGPGREPVRAPGRVPCQNSSWGCEQGFRRTDRLRHARCPWRSVCHT